MNTLSTTIFLTDKCNLACSYCYEPNKEYKTISRDDIVKFIKLLFDTPAYSSRKKIQLDFIGGEPLLEPDLIDFSIECFFAEGKRRNHPWIQCENFTIFATTNGTLFGEEKVQMLINKYPCLVLGVSLDGHKEAHDRNRRYRNGDGSYDKIMEHFAWWKNKFKQPFVKGTLGRNNLDNLADMLYHQVELGMVKPWANPVFEEQWTAADGQVYKEQIETFIDRLCQNGMELATSIEAISKPKLTAEREDYWCGTGKYMVALGLEGNLYPCHRFSTNTHKYDIGNVETGLNEEKLNTLFTNFEKFKCRDCKQNGGCPTCFASFYDIHQGQFAPVQNLCEMVKTEFNTKKYFVNQVIKASQASIKWGK
jgi:uncharacterized protein